MHCTCWIDAAVGPPSHSICYSKSRAALFADEESIFAPICKLHIMIWLMQGSFDASSYFLLCYHLGWMGDLVSCDREL